MLTPGFIENPGALLLPDVHKSASHFSVAPFRQDRAHLTIQENYIFALEYMVHTPLPERRGYPMSVNIEDNYIVTSRGVESLHPPNERILLIH